MMYEQTGSYRISVVVEGNLPVGYEDVVSMESFPRFNPHSVEPRVRVDFQISASKDVARPVAIENPIRQRPTPRCILLDSRFQKIHTKNLSASQVTVERWLWALRSCYRSGLVIIRVREYLAWPAGSEANQYT